MPDYLLHRAKMLADCPPPFFLAKGSSFIKVSSHLNGVRNKGRGALCVRVRVCVCVCVVCVCVSCFPSKNA